MHPDYHAERDMRLSSAIVWSYDYISTQHEFCFLACSIAPCQLLYRIKAQSGPLTIEHLARGVEVVTLLHQVIQVLATDGRLLDGVS